MLMLRSGDYVMGTNNATYTAVMKRGVQGGKELDMNVVPLLNY